jgi:hypothetical protein
MATINHFEDLAPIITGWQLARVLGNETYAIISLTPLKLETK